MPIENAIYWLLILLVFFGVGDLVSTVTKAKISSFFIIILLLLMGFLTGFLPADLVSKAGIAGVVPYVAALLIFHMGTLTDINTFIEQGGLYWWR